MSDVGCCWTAINYTTAQPLSPSEFLQKSETSGSDKFRRFQTFADKIQMISDHPELRHADISRLAPDICDLPVRHLESPLLPVANTLRALEDLLAVRHSDHPPINRILLARLGLKTVMGMDAVLPGSGVRLTVDRSDWTADKSSCKRCAVVHRA